MDGTSNSASREWEITLFPLGVAMSVLVTLSQILRFWSRALLPRNKFGLDDWTSLAAWVVTLAWLCGYSASSNGSWGQHVSSLTSAQISQTLKLIYVGIQAYNVSLFLDRCSALLFYRRVFATASYSRCRALIIGGLVVNALWLALWNLVMAFQCRPVPKFWESDIPGVCMSHEILMIANSATTVALDLYTLLLPMPILWRLHLPLSKKLFLVVLFAIGYCSVVASLGRLIAFIQIGNGINLDITYIYFRVFRWNLCELAVGVVGVNAPAVSHFLRRLFLHGPKALFTDKEMRIGGDSVPGETDKRDATPIGGTQERVITRQARKREYESEARTVDAR